jgi:hypothetical protein
MDQYLVEVAEHVGEMQAVPVDNAPVDGVVQPDTLLYP